MSQETEVPHDVEPLLALEIKRRRNGRFGLYRRGELVSDHHTHRAAHSALTIHLFTDSGLGPCHEDKGFDPFDDAIGELCV